MLATPVDLARKIAEKIEADLFDTICGGYRKPRDRCLALHRGEFISVEIDDAGNPIMPCPKCGPVLLCAEHMAQLT